jgi:hypothetical protein
MYIWKIKKLKTDLSNDLITERQSFTYFFALLVISTSLFSFAPFLPSKGANNIWDYVATASNVLIPLCGTVYVFIINRDSNGDRFFERFFSISWVLGIRLSALFIPFLLVVYLYPFIIHPELLYSEPEQLTDAATPAETLSTIACYIFFYYRLSFHISDVAKVSRKK